MQLVRPSTAAEDDSDLDTVLNSLRRIVRAIRVSSHGAETSLGISGAQLFVLQQITARPAASLREVAEWTHTDQSSVSVVVSRLVRRKLVARRTSAEDSRRAELTVTALGLKLLSKAPDLAQNRLVHALRTLAPRDLRVTARSLELISNTMGAGNGPPHMFFEGETRKRSTRTRGLGR